MLGQLRGFPLFLSEKDVHDKALESASLHLIQLLFLTYTLLYSSVRLGLLYFSLPGFTEVQLSRSEDWVIASISSLCFDSVHTSGSPLGSRDTWHRPNAHYHVITHYYVLVIVTSVCRSDNKASGPWFYPNPPPPPHPPQYCFTSTRLAVVCDGEFQENCMDLGGLF